jgi:GntR family transcriptional repressor for pyruvate dehydrogenase complex
MTAMIRTQKLCDAIVGHLERLILEGALKPGEKLAGERELALRFDVSRPSLRDAIEKLTARGLLRVTRNGTYVAEFLAPVMQPLASILNDNPRASADYFEFRLNVEGAAARIAAVNATSVDKDNISARLETMRKIQQDRDLQREAQADVDFHLAIYEATHNVVLMHVMRALSELLRNNIFYNRKALYERTSVREKLLEQHGAIAAAVIGGQPDVAEKEAVAHIAYTFGQVESIQRDGQRLEASLLRVGRSDLLAD